MTRNPGELHPYILPSMPTQWLAALCHEVNRAICEVAGDVHVSWHEAPDWQQSSAVGGVIFRANNLDAPVESQHEAWMRSKLADGWVYGETKDAEAKTHPCLVPYDDLPQMQKVKDHVFCAIVRAFTPRT